MCLPDQSSGQPDSTDLGRGRQEAAFCEDGMDACLWSMERESVNPKTTEGLSEPIT